MTFPRTILISLAALSSALFLYVSPCAAQASFVEGFDANGPVNPGEFGPANLISRGWIFRRQSELTSTHAFFDGYSSFFRPQAGAGYLGADAASIRAGPFSHWAILPPIPNQLAGDPLSLWVRGFGSLTQRLEIRYSPSGGIETGSSPTDVGNFTEALLTIYPVSCCGWQPFRTPLPGDGRIALRLAGQYVPASGGAYTGIDTLSVGPEAPVECNLPRIPSSGESVIWGALGSPYEICTDLVIPAGGTALVEPGVQVQGLRGTLTVLGSLVAQGTTDNRILFSAPLAVREGTLDLRFTDVRALLRPESSGTILLSDCTFAGGGLIFTLNGPRSPGFVRIERCTFTNTQVRFADYWTLLRDSNFANTFTEFLRGYTYVQGNVTTDGLPISIRREENIEPLYVDGVTATNVSTGGGLNLEGGNYLLGPNNVLQNNLYPVDIEGGLLPRSVVPPTGNINNMILAHKGASLGNMYWAALGVPYVVNGFSNGGGNMTIEPGVTVKFDARPGNLAGLAFASTRRLVADGLPDAPITFEALNPANPWDTVFFQSTGEGSRLEYTIFRGAKAALSVSDVTLEIQNSVIENNQRGIFAELFGQAVLSKTSVFNNGTGIQIDGPIVSGGSVNLHVPNMPNWFQGNGSAVENNHRQRRMPASENYWGDPSGPRYPPNPSGQGDPITGRDPTFVDAIPFLAEPPDMGLTPPVVRMVDPGISWQRVFVTPDFTLEPGSKFILRWEARETGAPIVAQKILLSPSGPYFSSARPPIVIADKLPASQRSFEITVPDIGLAYPSGSQFLRIVAVDSIGQEGWVQTPLIVTAGRITGDLRITSNYAGQTFIAGQPNPSITWEGSVSSGQVTSFIFLEADGTIRSDGTARNLPYVSTDSARQVLRVDNSSNDIKWFFSDHYFSIRLDPRLGLLPPSVQLLTPMAGDALASGSMVPITWTAEAQQGLYSFDIQTSTDGGLTWHLVVRHLPGTARSYDWQLPSSGGISDVRVRIIARDMRFQNSSDGATRVLSITP